MSGFERVIIDGTYGKVSNSIFSTIHLLMFLCEQEFAVSYGYGIVNSYQNHADSSSHDSLLSYS